MSDLSRVIAAQDETKAILANLRQGQILLETTSADFKPMMFAWEGANGVEALKRASETSTAFPIYPILKKEANSRKKIDVAPFPMDITTSAKGWESENHANFHNVKGLDVNGEQNLNDKPVAGFKSLDHVTLPTQFAWSRCNDNGQSDAANDASRAAASSESAPCPASPTRDNILPAYDDAVPVSAWKSVNHADFPPDADLAEEMPVSAGMSKTNKEAHPTYYAWVGSATVSQSEYGSNFLANSGEAVVHVKQTGKATLEGVFSSPPEIVKSTEAAAPAPAPAPVSAPAPEPELESKPESSSAASAAPRVNIIGCTEHYESGALQSESHSRYHVFDSVAKTERNKPDNGGTLIGVFQYAGIGSTAVSENHAAYKAAAAQATSEAPVEAPSAASSASAPAVAPAVEAAAAAPAVETVAPAPTPTPAPAVVAEESVTNVPAAMDAMDAAFETACSSGVSDIDNVQSRKNSSNNIAPAAAAVDAPAANPWSSKVPNPVVYQSTASSSFQWPKTVPPQRAAPKDGELTGGCVGPVPDSAVTKEAMTVTLSKEKVDRFLSEYKSHFSQPKVNMNERAITSVKKIPDSLWVLGTKGEKNVLLKEPDRSKKEPKFPQGYAQIDHLRGTSAMPLTSDTLDYSTVREVNPAPSKISSADPMAGYVPPVAQKNILRSKDQEIPGQIPSLREVRDPVAAYNAAPVTRPANLVPSQIADPILMYPRYPQLSNKQAHRFATTSRNSYVWRGPVSAIAGKYAQ